jgi:hypothetical protein
METLPSKGTDHNSSVIEDRLPEFVQAFRDLLAVLTPADASFEAHEEAALSLGNEVIRRCLQQELQEKADAIPQEIRLDQLMHIRRHHPGTVTYHSLCGGLEVRRWTYRVVGWRNGPTLVPLDKEAGLINRTTPAMARSLTLGYAKGPIRSYHEDLKASFRRPPSRATLERIAKAIGQEIRGFTWSIESKLREKERVPEGAVSIAMGIDRTSVPMEEDRPKDHVSTYRSRKRKKPRVRKKPKPVVVQWRMAYVGTVSFLDRHGDALATRRYATPADRGPRGVTLRIGEDLMHALNYQPSLKVVVVQDGAKELWNLMRDLLKYERRVKKWYEVLDLFHVLERLARILDGLGIEASERQARLRVWTRQLKRSNTTLRRMLTWIRRALRRQEKLGKDVDWSDLEYLRKRTKQMRYASMVRSGLPVASSITEGACKSLIAARAKRSGQRWRPEGLAAVLNLRAIYHSDRFDAFWPRFTQLHREKHIVKAVV